MSYIKINRDKITPDTAVLLIKLCPFGAISKAGGTVEIGPACKMCGVCVKKGPAGAVEIVRDGAQPSLDKNSWRGIAVYAEISGAGGGIHPVAFELLGKARELGRVTGHEVMALIIGHSLDAAAGELLAYGADTVYVYDDPLLCDFKIDAYTNAFADFVEKARPSSILVGATNLGRSLAPRVAARFGTGLTADCTSLEMRDNTDLVQIRPAFGGNIMAQIITPSHRPQLCTVRYKIFDALPKLPDEKITGRIRHMELAENRLKSAVEVIDTKRKPPETDISEAELIVACGRGIKSRDELESALRFAESIGAHAACTRPLVECGWFDPKRQIGLSGRTVKPKLIITLGVSGSVQFAAGMKNSDRIIAVNCDASAPIFKFAHIGLVGDWKEIIKAPRDFCIGGLYK